jgi:hypothetical protein
LLEQNRTEQNRTGERQEICERTRETEQKCVQKEGKRERRREENRVRSRG